MEEPHEEAKSSSLMTIVTNNMNSISKNQNSISSVTEHQKQQDLVRLNQPNNENDLKPKIIYNIKMLTS